MNIENKILSIVKAAAATIKTTVQYESGKYYETNIGTYLSDWLDKVKSESDTEIFEIRDVAGDVDDEQEPLQHELLQLDFVIGVKKGSSTSDYLRKAKADIYRMIGANIDSWRSTINGGLKPMRGGWFKDISYDKEFYGEMTVTIIFQYIQEEWLIGEDDY